MFMGLTPQGSYLEGVSSPPKKQLPRVSDPRDLGMEDAGAKKGRGMILLHYIILYYIILYTNMFSDILCNIIVYAIIYHHITSGRTPPAPRRSSSRPGRTTTPSASAEARP